MKWCNPRLFIQYNFSFYIEATFQQKYPPTKSKAKNRVTNVSILVFHTWSKNLIVHDIFFLFIKYDLFSLVSFDLDICIQR